MRPRRISRQKFPKRTRILSTPSKPHSFHSVHSAFGSRMNGMIFRLLRKRNSSQKNTNTIYSEYSYSGIVPKKRALNCFSDASMRKVLIKLQKCLLWIFTIFKIFIIHFVCPQKVCISIHCFKFLLRRAVLPRYVEEKNVYAKFWYVANKVYGGKCSSYEITVKRMI